MRKGLALLLLAKLSGWWQPDAAAQSQLSIEQYYNVGGGVAALPMPVAGFQTSNGFYAESRFNYEDANTLSFYMGRYFSKEGKVSYSISPMAGAVMGQYNGGSLAANISLAYKNFYLYSQPQYTFSLAGSINNYIYSWSDLTYSPKNWLSVGLTLQHTKQKKVKGYLENGFVIETALRNFSFPVYVFSPMSKERTFVFGATVELNFKKKKKAESRQEESFNDLFPANRIAENEKQEAQFPATKSQEKPFQKRQEEESVLRVRRVNVVVKTKAVETDKSVGSGQSSIRSEDTRVLVNRPADGQVFENVKKDPATASNQDSQERTISATPKKLSDQPVKPGLQPTTAPVIKQVTERVLFAILLSSFKTEEEALDMKLKLSETYFGEIVLYSQGNQFGLRLPGFSSEVEARNLSEAPVFKQRKLASSIVSYKLHNIDAIPLKQAPEAFKASKL